MLYALNAENKRKELQEYRAEVLFYDKTTGTVIVKQVSGDPEEKALNEYYNRKYTKNIGESTEGSAVLPISELKRMISNGEIVNYGEGLLTGYGIREKDAKINYEVRKNTLDTGLQEEQV